MSKLMKLVTLGAGEIDPLSVSEYEGIGGFKGLRKALAMTPLEIIGEVLEAKLLGRGGAAYPAGKKWEQLYHIEEEPKYIVCNADEGEPGTFKDRLIMGEIPMRLIEGMTIAGYVFGAREGYAYVRGEYRDIQKTLKRAIQLCKEKSYLGEGILGASSALSSSSSSPSPFSFDIKVISGAGAYVCGENSALLNSTEGKVGRPRIKPPHLAEVGLFLKPTLVNNVETFANIPGILTMGGKGYLSLGHPQSGGTKLICLSGHVKNPGVYEIPLGSLTLREIIFDPGLGGGLKDDRPFKFVHLGGQSGPIASERSLDAIYSYIGLRDAGLSIGSGAIVVMDRSVSILSYLKMVTRFFIRESCGKCVPCREGNLKLLGFLEKLSLPGGLSRDALPDLNKLLSAMRRASFCGLGQTAGIALSSSWKAFREEFEENLMGGDLDKTGERAY
jgi:NADH-quinone oxidoreductase subunit F